MTGKSGRIDVQTPPGPSRSKDCVWRSIWRIGRICESREEGIPSSFFAGIFAPCAWIAALLPQALSGRADPPLLIRRRSFGSDRRRRRWSRRLSCGTGQQRTQEKCGIGVLAEKTTMRFLGTEERMEIAGRESVPPPAMRHQLTLFKIT